MKMVRELAGVICAVAVMTMSGAGAAHAQLGGLLGGGSKNDSADSAASAESFLSAYAESRLNAEEADKKIGEALGDKIRVAAAQESIEALKSGASAANLGKVIKARGDVDYGVAGSTDTVLDANAKVVYAQGLVLLAKAVVKAKEAAGMAGDVGSSFSGNPLTMGAAAKDTLAVARDAPEYLTKLTKALSGAVKYAKKQGVDVSSDVTNVM